MRTSRANHSPAFAGLLAATRIAAGLSQEALAGRSGMSVRAISDLEHGRVARPRRSSVELLATALGLADGQRRDFLHTAGLATEESPRRAVAGSLCTLPPVSGVLVGREGNLAAIRQFVDPTESGDPPEASPPRPGGTTGSAVIVISGQPGVGKTTLAVAAGHHLADRFPDGQLFVALRGADASPVPPAEALARLLTALDCGVTVPHGLDERIARYRSALHGRRVLLILDNAVDEAQVRPLLPGDGCVTLVTSRRRLAGLPATERLFLDVLAESDAAGMLERIVGPVRCAAEPAATRELAMICGRLPLALHIAANRLASRPHWSLRRLVDRLGDQHRRLDELAAGDLTVQGPFEISHERLQPLAAALFRRLSLLAGPDFDAALAGPLIDVDAATAENILDELLEASLVEPAGADRYRLHDLLKLFAARKLEQLDPPAERERATDRLIKFILATAIRAGAFFEVDDAVTARLRRWRGGRPLRTRTEAAHWLAMAAPHWLDALKRAAARGWHRMVVDVGEAMHWYSDIHFQPDIWPQVFALSTAAARAGGLRAEEATQRNYLGWALKDCQGRPAEAMAEHEAALSLARDLGDLREQAWSLLYIGSLHHVGGATGGVDECRAALELMTKVGDRMGTATARHYLGAALHSMGQYTEAAEQLRQAGEYWRSQLRHDGPDGTMASALTYCLLWRARTLTALGVTREAVRLADEVVARFRAQQNSRGIARALLCAAKAESQAGDLAATLTRLDAVAEVSAQVGGLFEAESLLAAADLYERVGEQQRAAANRAKALSLSHSPEARRLHGAAARNEDAVEVL
ncbi:ATP-binding protein [Rhizomonospora bruguierae]|uniref:ATP-binding protein n=1 Tax=Rhizomonospora bruguierae TaxID=1581705 RepID=UPI001BCD23B4|nr:XRE family transcriptional regulator [Micromonospora sp. NBRC 107566]